MGHIDPPPILRQMSSHRYEEPPSYRASVQQTQSLDILQRIERKLANYNASQIFLKRWLFEINSWVVSAACMSAIVVMLLYCKNQPLSQRSIALTAHNVLSKLAAAALLFPISEAIGQLKWTWFRGSESKEMFDFEIFDKASRGAPGSSLLPCSQCVKIEISELLTYACLNTTIDWSAHSNRPTKDVPTGQVCGYFLNATSGKPTLMSRYLIFKNTSVNSSRGEALLVRVLSLTELFAKKSFYGTGSIHFKSYEVLF